jgi:hypothetical protein
LLSARWSLASGTCSERNGKSVVAPVKFELGGNGNGRLCEIDLARSFFLRFRLAVPCWLLFCGGSAAENGEQQVVFVGWGCFCYGLCRNDRCLNRYWCRRFGALSLNWAQSDDQAFLGGVLRFGFGNDDRCFYGFRLGGLLGGASWLFDGFDGWF